MAVQMFNYSVKYRRNGFSTRVYRATVVARDADDARRLVAIRDPEFSHAIAYPKRRGEVVPEQADGLTASKARDDLRDGVAHFDWHGHDIEVEVV